jgi:hypothetical protein
LLLLMADRRVNPIAHCLDTDKSMGLQWVL